MLQPSSWCSLASTNAHPPVFLMHTRTLQGIKGGGATQHNGRRVLCPTLRIRLPPPVNRVMPSALRPAIHPWMQAQ